MSQDEPWVKAREDLSREERCTGIIEKTNMLCNS